MRNITTTTNSILTILAGAQIAPAEQDNILTLQAELRIIAKTASYLPTESNQTSELWARLGTALYRFMPPVQQTGYTADISALIQG